MRQALSPSCSRLSKPISRLQNLLGNNLLQTLPVSGAYGPYLSALLAYPPRWCSAFYERLKDVRDYHRRYPYLEVSEVSAAATCFSALQHSHTGKDIIDISDSLYVPACIRCGSAQTHVLCDACRLDARRLKVSA